LTKSFFRKNDFLENIFRRLAHTNKSPTAKIGIAGFWPNDRNPASFGLNLATAAERCQIPAANIIAGIQWHLPDSGNRIPLKKLLRSN